MKGERVLSRKKKHLHLRADGGVVSTLAVVRNAGSVLIKKREPGRMSRRGRKRTIFGGSGGKGWA